MIEDTSDRNQPSHHILYLRIGVGEPNSRAIDAQVQALRDRLHNSGARAHFCRTVTERWRKSNLTEPQRLLHDIQTGKLKCDVITCDTMARFSRAV